MAIASTGSALFFNPATTANTGTVSTTITVPANTDFICVGIVGYDSNPVNTFSGGSLTFTKGGVDTAMTAASNLGDSSASFYQGAMFYMVAPDVGANKTLKWDWSGTTVTDQFTQFSITFWSGVNQSTPVRSTSGVQAGSVPYTSGTLTGQSGDTIIAWAFGFVGGAAGTIDSWSNLTLFANMDSGGADGDGAWATNDLSSSFSNTVAASTATNYNDGGIVAIVAEPAAGGGGTGLGALLSGQRSKLIGGGFILSKPKIRKSKKRSFRVKSPPIILRPSLVDSSGMPLS